MSSGFFGERGVEGVSELQVGLETSRGEGRKELLLASLFNLSVLYVT